LISNSNNGDNFIDTVVDDVPYPGYLLSPVDLYGVVPAGGGVCYADMFDTAPANNAVSDSGYVDLKLTTTPPIIPEPFIATTAVFILAAAAIRRPNQTIIRRRNSSNEATDVWPF